MFSTLSKLLLKLMGGSRNERLVRARMDVVTERINPVGDELMRQYMELVHQIGDTGLSREELEQAARQLKLAPLAAKPWLEGKSVEFRRRLAEGATPDDILPEAFAVTRLASWLARDHRQFDVQMAAGQVLFEHSIAEEATGEGKTIACYPAIYVAALTGMKVHVVTVNDYLVRRDCDFAAPIFELVGMRVGAIQQPMDNAERQRQYACDVIYGTNSEFGFDYLRDNMKWSVEDQVQGPQDFAIVDEVDSILIDEARTPLIISGPAFGDVSRYKKGDAVVREIIRRHRQYDQAARRAEAAQRRLKAVEGEIDKSGGEEKKQLQRELAKAQEELAEAQAEQEKHVKYYEVELDKKSGHFTHEGITAAQEVAGIGSFYVGANMEWPHLLEQSLRAHTVYQRDKDYVVREGEIVIVDEFTGRLMEGRQWSDGLHQAVEAKEGVTVKEETQTLATITLQNLFKLYRKLAGMTGTAMTEAEEFMKIYKLDVVSVPTHRPVNRVDHDDRIYGTAAEKYDALVEEINAYSKRGRPVLVGTTSIEKSELLSGLLTHRHGIAHETLNARPENAAREADIVAYAGMQRPLKSGSKERVGNVTIATNMAGRGTDIKLGLGVVWGNCKVPSAEKFAELGVMPQALFPPGSTKCCIHCPEHDPRTNCAHCFKPKLDADFPQRGRTACPVEVPCGLHIVGTERHEARRIDNQLRGRSGRQGDPGSSRFFLSLEDELITVFAGEWMLKALKWMGLEGGQAIEHRRISKGIAQAQKKVEQRNFDIRKNLLEYDEVMDHQRRVFYSLRQRILEGREVQTLVLEMVEQAIDDGVDDYLSPEYPRRCIAEGVRQNLELNLRPDQVRAEVPDDLSGLEIELRQRAKEEAGGVITMTIGEYADASEPPEEWDLRGLASWAMSRFRVNLSQNQLRGMALPEIEQLLNQKACEYIASVDLGALGRFLEPNLGARALTEWLGSKFGIEVSPGELSSDDLDATRRTLRQAVDHVYLRREIEYPVEYAVDMTVGRAGLDNAYAVKALLDWVNGKYDVGWTEHNLVGKTIEDIRRELVDLAESFLAGPRLEQTVDAFLNSVPGGPEGPDPQAVREFARKRFDTKLPEGELDGGVRQRLPAVGRSFLRRELTALERYVLLQIYDSSWKDHLLAMDHIKGGVGLRGYAEQDPKIAYKKEGFRQFEEMLSSVRGKVTDIIFKVRLDRPESQVGGATVYQISNMVHDQMSAYDALARDMAAQQQAAAAERQVVQPIRRATPKVGRNDPCPCGSGKKYKKCCGAGG